MRQNDQYKKAIDARNANALKTVVSVVRERDGIVQALCEAVRFRLLDLVKEMLDEGINPNNGNKEGVTPLMYCNHKAIGKILLKYGSEINARDLNGRTPLIWAVLGALSRKEAQRYIEWLIQEGADPNDVSNNGESAREIAQQKYGICI